MKPDVQRIYKRRFGQNLNQREALYRVLCGSFLQQFIPEDSVVLDVAAGYCNFLNNIKAAKKIAVDLNPDIKKHANCDIEIIISTSTDLSRLANNSIDVVYVSNFLEHLSKEDIIKTLNEIHRVLKVSGKILIIQPNYRYCHKDYWMFFDHLTPLDDRSLTEALEINGFEVILNKPKFLPFTLKNRLPKNRFLLKIYLKSGFLQSIFGQQAFVAAKKIESQ